MDKCKEIYLSDIFLIDDCIKLILNSESNCIRLKNELNKIDINTIEKQINLNNLVNQHMDLLTNHNEYTFNILNGQEEIEIILKNKKSEEDQYICKNKSIRYFEKKVFIDVYFDKKSNVKVRINEEKKYKSNIDGLIVTDESIDLRVKIDFNEKLLKDLNQDHIKEKINLTSSNIKIICYDTVGRSHIYPGDSIEEDKIIFKLVKEELLTDDEYNLYCWIVIDDEIVDVQHLNEITFRKILLKNRDSIKILSFAKDEKTNKFVIVGKESLLINPVMEKIICSDTIVMEGTLKSEFDIYDNKNVKAILSIISRDKKYNMEKEVKIKDDEFKINMDNQELFELKSMYIGYWDITVDIYFKDRILASNKVTFKEHNNFLLDNSIQKKDEMLIFKPYLTKVNRNVVFQIKNKINIKELISIIVKQSNVIIKLRFEENISQYYDDKEINISVFNQSNEKLGANKLIKNGDKTLSVKLRMNKTEEFIKHITQEDLKINVTVNNELYIQRFKDIDKNIILFNLIDRILYSPKYKKLYKIIYKKLFLNLPMSKNTIMFESFLGRNCSGNPKYIYEYLVKSGIDKKYNLIWILNNTDEEITGNCKKVKRRSIKYYYYMATSKYWIFNCRQDNGMVKRKGNVYLQTWHGTPLKKLGMDMDNVNMAGQTDINKYKEEFRKNSSTWDYLISQNDYSAEIFKRAFAFNKEMLDYGYPANDILYTKNNEPDINEIKGKLNIPKDKKIILYAPTWRDDNFLKKGHYIMSIQLELDQMQKALGDEYVVLLRMHYLIMNTINIEDYKGFVYNFSEGYDIQELYLISDILITDYSSVMFDYSNLRRPIIFFAYDIENYRDSLRGFYFDFENEAPGPIVKTTEEVIDIINNIDNINNEYKSKQEAFYNKFCHIDDGSAAERIIKHILK